MTKIIQSESRHHTTKHFSSDDKSDKDETNVDADQNKATSPTEYSADTASSVVDESKNSGSVDKGARSSSKADTSPRRQPSSHPVVAAPSASSVLAAVIC